MSEARPLVVEGKVAVVTGASTGIGFETAKGLAAKGVRVAMVCRRRESGEAAVCALRDQTATGLADLFVADLSSQGQVRRLAREIGERYDRVDVLVNNAAAIYSRRVLSEDGIEMQLAVNHLAAYLLSRLLLDRLHRAGAARVVTVTSRAHARGRIDFDDLGAIGRYSGLAAYNRSKLANVLFTYELARRLAGTGVTANCLSPGLVRTRIGNKHATYLHSLAHSLLCLLGGPPAKGAQGIVHLATAIEMAGMSGKYFVKGRAARSSALSYDRGVAGRLWQVSATLTGLPPD